VRRLYRANSPPIRAKGSMELLFSLDRVAANVQAACPLED
jgi:hypothetical protein